MDACDFRSSWSGASLRRRFLSNGLTEVRRGGSLGNIGGKNIPGRGNIPGPTVATRLVYLRKDQGHECGSAGGTWRRQRTSALRARRNVGSFLLGGGIKMDTVKVLSREVIKMNHWLLGCRQLQGDKGGNREGS